MIFYFIYVYTGSFFSFCTYMSMVHRLAYLRLGGLAGKVGELGWGDKGVGRQENIRIG